MAEWSPDRNAQAMRPKTLTPLKTFERKLGELGGVVAAIERERDMLVELWRRAEQASSLDGYSASSMGLGVQSQSEDTSVESAALGTDVPDQILAALSEAVAEVDEAHGMMRRVQRRLVFAKAAGESHRGRQATGGDCLCCDEFVSGAPDDRLRAGFCPACWTAWGRFRQGSDEEQGALRRQFIAARRYEIEQTKGQGA